MGNDYKAGGSETKQTDEGVTDEEATTSLTAVIAPPKPPSPVTVELKVTAEGRMSWGV